MKQVLFGNEARAKLKKGVDLIANAIKITLGPRGRNVTYGFHYGFPICSKDGVTISKQVESNDQMEQLGLLLIRQVAQKTADDAGDGTTTASLLAQAIFNEGLLAISRGVNPILVKKGIDLAVADAIKYISNYVVKNPTREDLIRVATISANNDSSIAKIICEAIDKAGADGVITIEDNYRDSTTYVHTVEGMQLNEGYLSPYFVTNKDKMEAVYQNAYILIADYEINHIQPLMKAIELTIGQEKKPLIIVANNITGQALETLVVNRIKGGLPIVACKAPYFGDNRTEQLTDLAILTGGRVVGQSSGLIFDKIELEDFGQVENVVVSKHHTTYTGGKGKDEDVQARVKVLENSINITESDYEKEKLQERLAKLTSGVAVIKVGAATEVEQKESKFRIEDALCSCRASLEEGIICGGGVSLFRASEYLSKRKKFSLWNLIFNKIESEKEIGYNIIVKSLKEPIKQISYNSGYDTKTILNNIIKIEGFNFGFDFLNNEYCNLLDKGIVDPFKVVRLTLENAASVAGTLLTTEVAICETVEDEYPRTPKPRSE